MVSNGEANMRQQALREAINASKEGDDDAKVVARAETFYKFLAGE